MDSHHVDHYAVLGLPSGEEGFKLSQKEISKAYRSKALELHPDKRLDDPNAHANFQKLKTSYEILMDKKARKLFDDLFMVKHEKSKRQSHHDAKRRRMMADLDARERAASRARDDAARAREEEERISNKLKEELARIRAMQAYKTCTLEKPCMGAVSIDKEKALKVSWEKGCVVGYTAQQLMELFGEFGKVEDVVIKSSKSKGSAIVVMASKDAIESVCGVVLGDLSNPLLVVPLMPVNMPTDSSPFSCASSKLGPHEYQAFEDSVLEKLRKAAQRQKELDTQ
ncbi:unnamed protein product [Cuscuta epithymum]|uniref:J domain-containing protein n=1 Tax=Cuscuta epithymum TaxID=186058 RepID=A0AAV0GFP7_9ASTE|nr:unnamed protein product [Cuscuta epithymum]